MIEMPLGGNQAFGGRIMKRLRRVALGAHHLAFAVCGLIGCGSTAYLDFDPSAKGSPIAPDRGVSGGASGSCGATPVACSSASGSADSGTSLGCNEVCDDGIDNDMNGYVDCFDRRCRFDAACAGRFCDLDVEASGCHGLVCPDGADMPSSCQCEIDHHLVAPVRQSPDACCGKVCPAGQFLDSTCSCYGAQSAAVWGTVIAGREVCNDGIDNDHNGYVDCFDAGCAHDSSCVANFCDLSQHASGCGGLVCPPGAVKDASCVCLAGARVVAPLVQDINDCCGQGCGVAAYRDAKCVCRWVSPPDLPGCLP